MQTETQATYTLADEMIDTTRAGIEGVAHALAIVSRVKIASDNSIARVLIYKSVMLSSERVNAFVVDGEATHGDVLRFHYVSTFTQVIDLQVRYEQALHAQEKGSTSRALREHCESVFAQTLASTLQRHQDVFDGSVRLMQLGAIPDTSYILSEYLSRESETMFDEIARVDYDTCSESDMQEITARASATSQFCRAAARTRDTATAIYEVAPMQE